MITSWNELQAGQWQESIDSVLKSLEWTGKCKCSEIINYNTNTEMTRYAYEIE